jgi:7-cyano-7-deazaguanine synthase
MIVLITVANAAVLTSGGIDSTACGHFLKTQDNAGRCVFIEYGQAAATRERTAVTAAIAKFLQVPLSAHRSVAASTFPPGELGTRNAFLITAGLFLDQISSGLLAIGIHAGTLYYDCSAAFFELMSRLVSEHTDGAVRLIAALLNWRKREVFDYFADAGLRSDLTYSCEAGTDPICRRCASCWDRQAIKC